MDKICIKNNILTRYPPSFPKSPLRYPGGKARAVNIILSLIPSSIDCLISPFIGGGSVEIAIASCGIQVFGFDIFKPLTSFWMELINNPETLADKVNTFFPLSKQDFYRLQKLEIDDQLEQATIFYVLNRSSFSGSTLSGGMSPGHPRFTRSSIEYLRNFRCDNLIVKNMGFEESITLHPNTFAYLDPPYLINSNLYGKKGDTHKNFDHYGLYSLLNKRNQWILSYNNCSEIRKLYNNYKIIEPQWQYGMSNDKNSREIIVLSRDVEESILSDIKNKTPHFSIENLELPLL